MIRLLGGESHRHSNIFSDSALSYSHMHAILFEWEGVLRKKTFLNMMIKMVIILMFDHDNAQKPSTTMTLWSKYASFKH